ncbi:MAG: type II secretion system F family protein [Planctomycetes bacterium]|nr:type II secretion system F family protein [Planctomycetota bacterium]
MPKYLYTVRGADGKPKKGTISAINPTEATIELKKQGLTVLTVKAASDKKGGFALFRPKAGSSIKADDLMVFTRQLSTMIGAGIPLLESLEILQEQTDNESFKLTLGGVVEKVRGGADFSESLEAYPKVFARIYVSMIRAGEAGGQLDAILVRLAEYQESTQALRREIKSAMTYPVISLAMIFLIVGGLMIFIVPKFKSIFTSMGIELPLPTKILMGTSDAMQNYWYIWIGAIVGLIFAFGAFKKTKKGARVMDWLSLNAPVFGDLFTKVAVSRFCRTFATLIKSGVPILGALEIVASTSGNILIEDTVNDAKESVRKGETLSAPLSQNKIFPPMVTRMIGIGEKSGALEALLEKISDFYDQQVSAAVESLTSMIEPLLIGVMGAVVGGIVLAVFMPIFKIQSAVMGKK